ncbi:MAG: iron-containing alcohol dehydrogenase [Pseudomonadota bacterium]
MQAFTFQYTPSVLCEPGASGKIGKIVSEMGCKRVAFVTDAGVLKLGLADQALASLKEADVAVVLFSDVQADPPRDMILDIASKAKAEGVDGVVSLGGGSSLDTAKLIAVLVKSEQALDEMYGIDQVRGKRLPLLLIPTTAGTGSEVTPIAIVTTGVGEKKGVVARQLLPDWAVLDADLTLGLPAKVTAATGIDAMVHAIEAYTSKIKKNSISDCLAKEALALLGGNIRTVCSNGADREARSSMLLGSMLAGIAFTNAPVAAVHALAYPLGSRFHIPHGHANALVLPHVLAFNLPEAEQLYAEIAPLIFPELLDKPFAQRASGLVDGFLRLSGELGLEDRLAQMGILESDLPGLAADAMKQTRLLANNPREMTYEAALRIYQAAH